VEISVVRRAELTDAHYREFATFVADRNDRPAQHIGYLGREPDDVTAELHELAGEFVAVFARDGTGLVGVLGMEWDTDIERAYLLGPWGDSADLLDRLYATARAMVPDHIADHEIFCNLANTAVLEFARRHGFGPPREQYILRFDRASLAALPQVTLPLLTPAHHDRFAALHDRAFPNTHAPAATLLAKGEPVRVVVEDDRLLGYVILALRPEYDDAQVEYIAVEESARGKGIGARMLTAALHVAFADDRFTHMGLVTNNPVARRLYEKVGFVLEHEMRSFSTVRGG
jgi:ribosomal protein S18 acetylase RimI-like enzyme